MKHGIFLTLFLAGVLAAGTFTPAFAQDYNSLFGRGERDWNRGGSDYDQGARDRWQRFLDSDENRNFAREFRGNPNIIHDRDTMDQWTGVQELFRDHPDVRNYVFQRVRDYDQNTRPGEKWRRELDANPNFADRFRSNPDVINDPNLRHNEPEIAEFFRTNPEVRDYVENHSRDSGRNYRDYND
ncbi:MAG TPA: hypothetical protein VGR40_03705 [Candidatus Binatus sp.]|nr:hypothetical protein [Candidatus Binatus sp.]